jgi:cell division septation protein DedD
MAEVQTNTQSGELSQRFIEFVMMQAQNAALFLGQIPNPQTGQGEVNLDLAKMFIDQLGMIQEKTRGNLTNEETAVLRNTLSNLQMAFVEVSQQSPSESRAASPQPAPAEPPAEPSATSAPAEPNSAPAAPPAETESRKKFTKSYGA